MINPINSGTDLESPRKTLKRINSYKEHTTEDGKSYYSSVDNPKEVVWNRLVFNDLSFDRSSNRNFLFSFGGFDKYCFVFKFCI